MKFLSKDKTNWAYLAIVLFVAMAAGSIMFLQIQDLAYAYEQVPPVPYPIMVK